MPEEKTCLCYALRICAFALYQVVVTGAGGRTGKLLFEKLKARSADFDARGFVRTDESKAAIGGGSNVHVVRYCRLCILTFNIYYSVCGILYMCCIVR